MRRGTTPTIKIKLKGCDINNLEKIYVTFKQGKYEFEKSMDQLNTSDETLFIKLSQDETLQLDAMDGSTPVHSLAPDSITAQMPTSYMWSLEQKIQQQQASLHPHRPSRAMRAGRVMLTITWKVKKSENGSTP